jgi:hypothetical protein
MLYCEHLCANLGAHRRTRRTTLFNRSWLLRYRLPVDPTVSR